MRGLCRYISDTFHVYFLTNCYQAAIALDRVGRPHASPDTKLINCLCTALFLFFYGLKWIKKTVELRGLIYFLSTSQTSPEPDVSTL